MSCVTSIMGGASDQNARHVSSGSMKKWNEYQWQQRGMDSSESNIQSINRDTAQRKSMGDIAEESQSQPLTSHKRADSLQPRTSTSPQPRRSSDIEHLVHPAAISAHLRSSHTHDDAQRPRRYSSAEHHASWPPPMHAHSVPEIRRLSGNFNAPTHVEVERHDEHNRKRSLSGIGKLKSAVKGLMRV